MNSNMDQGSPQVLHNYGTRKRQNSAIRPSLRLRQQSDNSPSSPLSYLPRRIKPLGCVASNANPTVYLKLSCNVPDNNAQIDVEKRCSTQHIEFPPSHVVLHPEDASNKVFIAMGRAFLSVNNCAMTVKDLAELTMKFGLVCQNVSAAAQAITCFIRNHLHRCEVEQDFPLLLRFALSGTGRDDCLAPALYSRSGGNVGKEKAKENIACDKNAAHPDSEESDNHKQDGGARLTCFRRGTTVWYLSRAAGAQCPFARCGIALRDFTDSSLMGEAPRRACSSNYSKEVRESSVCGSKRKRAGLRSTSGVPSRDSREPFEDATEEEAEDSCEGSKPPKVKLTLRLKPCLSIIRHNPPASSSSSSSESETSEDEEDDADMDIGPSPAQLPQVVPQPSQDNKDYPLPPYPIQRRISIPPYTPSQENYPPFSFPTVSPPQPSTSTQKQFEPYRRRSPSVPMSVSSPAPDSDEESDDDFFTSRDAFESFDWEEGPSYSRPIEVKKEEEVNDMMRGMIDWNPFGEDILATSVNAIPIKAEVEAVSDPRLYAVPQGTKIKTEEADTDLSQEWISDTVDGRWSSLSPNDLQSPFDWVKPEVDETEGSLELVTVQPTDDGIGASSLNAVRMERRDVESLWKDVELLDPDSVSPQEFEEEWQDISRIQRRHTVSTPQRVSMSRASPARNLSLLPSSSTSSFTSPRVQPLSLGGDISSPSGSVPSCSSPGMTAESLPSPSPSSPYSAAPMTPSADDHMVDIDSNIPIIHPLEYCGPIPIIVTYVDGLPVYCAVSAVPRLYRRIDNDAVHIASLASFLRIPPPEPYQNSDDVFEEDHIGSLSTDQWAPLNEARAFVLHVGGEAHDLDLFLSEGLYRRFPYEIHEFKPLSTTRGMSDSEVDVEQQTQTPRKKAMPVIMEVPASDDPRPWERGMMAQVDVDDLILYGLDNSSTRLFMAWPDNSVQPNLLEMPLSPQEEEAFQSLCQFSEYDGDAVPSLKTRGSTANLEDAMEEENESRRVTRSMKGKDTMHEPPLRRSQRTAKKIASQRIAMTGSRQRSRAFSSS